MATTKKEPAPIPQELTFDAWLAACALTALMHHMSPPDYWSEVTSFRWASYYKEGRSPTHACLSEFGVASRVEDLVVAD